jgi:Common central domain of tyrosinase/Polyphenol oxidase middle domain
MKKILLLAFSLVSGIFILNSFSHKRTPKSVKRPVNVISCLPGAAPNLITAAAFRDKYAGPAVIRVRKNVFALTDAEINAIKVGIIKMRSLPYTNPISYGYQTAIHGTLLPDNLPQWNYCHRPGEEAFFLAWHRLYIYFFERILRSQSGRENLTLPYWNCNTNPMLHPAYRDASPANPLYHYRNPAINAGGILPASIGNAYNTALNAIPYYTFQGALNGPHGSVHTTVNGDMATVVGAAKDPVFWLHHSNIDRIWEEWLSRCNGRINPVDSVWLNQVYTFFDETGEAVSMQGSQILQAATQLNYKYDSIPAVTICGGARPSLVSSVDLVKKSAGTEMKGERLKAEFTAEAQPALDEFLKKKNRKTFNFSNRANPEILVLNFDDIQVRKVPEGVVEVYLNLPPGVEPVYTSKYFVGLLDLFSAQHASHREFGQAENKIATMLDASNAAKAQRLTPADLRNATISLVVKGVEVKGQQVKSQADISIPNIRFSLQQLRYNN